MTPLTDDELRRHIGRRANRQALSSDDRRELLASIGRDSRTRRRPLYLLGWPLAGVTSAAAAVVVMVAATALLLPRVPASPEPGASAPLASPTQSAIQPTDEPDTPKLTIYTTSEASAMAADPANEGRVIIVALHPNWPCPGDVPCDDAGFMAVQLAGDAAFVGTVGLAEGARAWTVDELRAAAGSDPLTGLVPVDGWLVRERVHSCPSSTEAIPAGYGCGGETWVAAAEGFVSAAGDGGYTLSGDSLRVQDGAYERFAHRPAQDADGFYTARRGIYLVRPVECRVEAPKPNQSPSTTIRPRSVCKLWEVVGRIEPPLAVSVEPSPSASAPGSQHEILGAVAEWIAHEESPLEDFLYVHSVVADVGLVLLRPYGPAARDPGLRDAGPPLFEGGMTESTIEAIETALEPATAVFITDPADVREPDDRPGVCEPFLHGRRLIQIGPPRANAAGDGYFVTVLIGNGCHGSQRVLEVIRADGEYLVARAVLDGSFIVD